MYSLLYVDDEPGLLEIGRLFLEQTGDYAVTCVLSGSEALALLKNTRFDAIVSDYQMPGMDGIGLLKEVRHLYGAVPFILFTGRGREEVVIDALNNGADFYLQKGGEPKAQYAELANKIGYAVARKRAEQELQHKNDELNASYEQIAANEVVLRQQLDKLTAKQEALKNSEEKFRAFTENIPDLTTITDMAGRYTYISPSIQRITGQGAKELLGKKFREIETIFGILPEDKARLLESGRLAIQHPGESVPVPPFHIHDPAGAIRFIEGTHTYLPGIKGIQGIVFHGREVTDRIRAQEAVQRKNDELNASYEQIAASEEELKGQCEEIAASGKRLTDSEKKFRAIFEKTRDALILFTDKGCIDCNQQALNLFGCSSRDELLGKLPVDMSPPVQPDGKDSRIAAEAHIRSVYEKGSDHFEWLHTRCDRSTFLADVLFSAFELDKKPVFLSSVRDITERKQAEAALREREEKYRHILETMQDAYLRIDRDGNIAMANPSAAQLYGYGCGQEMIGIPADTLYQDPEDRRRLFKMMREAGGRAGDLTMYGRRRDGTSFWGSLNVQELTDTSGKVSGIEAIVRVITDRVMTEHALGEANRKLNLLSSITCHDATGQLTALSGYLKMAMVKETDPAVAAYLFGIERSAEAISRQLGFVRTYREVGMKAPAWFRIENAVAQDTGAPVKVDPACNRYEIYADPMLTKVFLNLFENAVRHGEHVTEIGVRCETGGDELLIIVEDNGAGVPGDEKERIFKKGFGKNTGFGLFLSKEILAITGIGISENGTPGKGARFEIRVPAGAYRIEDGPQECRTG